MNLLLKFEFSAMILISLASYALASPTTPLGDNLEAKIRQEVRDKLSGGDINPQKQIALSKMLVFAAQKNDAALLANAKDIDPNEDRRLRLCLAWCLYIANPAKHAARYVEEFPTDMDGVGLLWPFLWWKYSPDPYDSLAAIAQSGNEKAIEKLLVMACDGFFLRHQERPNG